MASQFTTPNSNQIARRRPCFLSSLFAAIVFISAAQGQSAYIRVNQVGYPSAESKRAYLMATGSENGTTFVVKNSAGITVYSGAVGATLGAWGSFKFVYPIDFDSVTTAGQSRRPHRILRLTRRRMSTPSPFRILCSSIKPNGTGQTMSLMHCVRLRVT